MPEYMLGKRERISYGFESSWGGAVAPTTLLAVNAEWNPSRDVHNWQENRSGSDVQGSSVAGPEDRGGILTFTPQNWEFLQYAFGTFTNNSSTTLIHHPNKSVVASGAGTTYTSTRCTDGSAWDLSEVQPGMIASNGTSYGIITVVNDTSNYVDVGAWYPTQPTNTDVCTIRNNNDTLPSFTLERAIQATTDRVRTYEGCKVNRLTIRWDAGAGVTGRGAFISIEADVVAEDVTPGTTTTALANMGDVGYQSRNVTLTLNNSAVTACVGGEINVNDNFTDGRYSDFAQNPLISEPVVQRRDFSGTFTIHYEDDTFLDFWNDAVVVPGTTVQNTLRFSRTAVTDEVTFYFYNLRIVSPPDPTNLDGINVVTLNWIADNIIPIARDSDTYDIA